MSYFMDGDDSSNEKKTIFEKSQQYIDYKLTKLYTNNVKNSYDAFDISIFEALDSAYELLSDINFLKERLNFELAKYGKTSSYPNSLNSYERVGEFGFFITMLGYIDSNIAKCNREVEFNGAFFEYDETAAKRYTEYKNFKGYLMVEREKVVSAYRNYISTNANPENDFDSCLDTIPCSALFGKLSLSEFNSKSFSPLLNKFMIAYNLGYAATAADYKKVLLRYEKLYKELVEDSSNKNNKSGFQKKKTNNNK